MQKTNYIQVGSFQKPVGTCGEIKVEIEDKFWDDVADVDHLFVKVNGVYIPFFIEYIKEANYLLLKLEEVDSREDAAYFTLQGAYLREKDINSQAFRAQNEKMGWENYAIEVEGEKLGKILEITIYPQQVMATLNYKGKNILLPLVDTWIVGVDDTTMTIQMVLPEGILEI